ncbi:MAG: hypothetical protein V1722_04480 [Candidatus Micrarchaeota archaeon]
MHSHSRPHGQVTIEFLVITAGLLAAYALVLPSLVNSFQQSSFAFNSNVEKAIARQIAWKIQQVNLLEEGSELQSVFYSTSVFQILINQNEVSLLNSSFPAQGALPKVLQVPKGNCTVLFAKTLDGVEIQLK